MFYRPRSLPTYKREGTLVTHSAQLLLASQMSYSDKSPLKWQYREMFFDLPDKKRIENFCLFEKKSWNRQIFSSFNLCGNYAEGEEGKTKNCVLPFQIPDQILYSFWISWNIDPLKIIIHCWISWPILLTRYMWTKIVPQKREKV